MAEEKHRMLYQGQDPSQPVLRPLPIIAHVSNSSSDRDASVDAATEPQQPPTYDDAMGTTTSLRVSKTKNHAPSHTSSTLRATCDGEGRRRTFFAEPLHLRTQLDEPHPLEAQPAQPLSAERPAVEPQAAPADNANVQAMPQQQQQQQQQSVLVERVRMPQVRSFFALAPQPKLGAKACAMVCPACGQQGRTRLRRMPNTRTHCWALWLCSIGWCCCACLYPYLMNSCRTTSHYCTICKTFLGAHYPKDCCH
ncbi:uncharacterized protein LOC115764358 isoform X1 [Drosophila novamexicana]|uniref:uncharacterized protein LOC115764358 isoform X1 n=1 Tax=Drosophila novamexicana TaxID=47314 RepID=UPI0011E5F000|nr:uncharacterized protein LOC115764358 isoform X1 [Drosophila novamexicana]